MDSKAKVALVTGGAVRVGRGIVEGLHNAGYNVVIHCNTSKGPAEELKCVLEKIRPGSSSIVSCDLSGEGLPLKCKCLIEDSFNIWGQLDLLVNNAANFLSNSLLELSDDDWNTVMDTNVKAPSFLMKEADPYLKKTNGVIVNIIDIFSEKATKQHYIHIASKAALHRATECAAVTLAPEVRVNGISPGCIMWPAAYDESFSNAKKTEWINKTPLRVTGAPSDVADLVVFLASDKASFITGQILRLDGGRSINF